MTVLTSELTHFNLVIHLSKLQQPALPFSSFFRVVPLFLRSHLNLERCILPWEAVLNNHKPPFLQQPLQLHDIMSSHCEKAGTRPSGVVFFLFGCLVRSNILCI